MSASGNSPKASPRVRKSFIEAEGEVPLLQDPAAIRDLYGISNEWRAELGLTASEPFDYMGAAERLKVLVREISQTNAKGAAKNYLLFERPSLVRAALQKGEFGEFGEFDYALVLNDTHAPRCEQFTATHELSHIVLGHATPHVTAIVSSSEYKGDSPDEREANTLAIFALLPVPPANLEPDTRSALAEKYGVFERHVVARHALEMLLRDAPVA